MLPRLKNQKILAFVYNKKTRKFFLFKTKGEDVENHGLSKWYTITGNIEERESFEEGVKREVYEEAGLIVKEVYDLKWGCKYKWKDQVYEERYFIAFVDSDRIKLDNVELIDYMILGLNEFVESLAWNLDKEELKSMLEKGVSKKIKNDIPRFDSFI